MSEDEAMVMFMGAPIACVLWLRWMLMIALVPRATGARRLLQLTPFLCAGVLFAVLKSVAAVDVRDDVLFLGFYVVFGALWLGVAATVLPLFGLSVKEDVAERKNPAAAWAIGGALVAITLCFAGANIGDGPGWWVVAYAAMLSTVTLAVMWVLLHWSINIADLVTIERDPATGMRVAGLLVAQGIVLGRGSAGNWHGAQAALVEFAQIAWFAPLLLAGGMLVEKSLAPSPEHPERPVLANGVMPAVTYVMVAIFYVALRGWWS